MDCSHTPEIFKIRLYCLRGYHSAFFFSFLLIIGKYNMASSRILHDQDYTTIISVSLGFVDSGHSSGLPQVVFIYLFF